MKKLGFLFIAALISQGAMADKVAANYASMTVAIAEAGVTLNWAPQLADKNVSEHQSNLLDAKTQAVTDKMTLKLEQRIAAMIEGDLEH